MNFLRELFNKSNTSCQDGGEVNKYNKNNRPVMICLADRTEHRIKDEFCIISKVGVINDIAYIYTEFGKEWYKVDLLNNSVEKQSSIKNIENWEYITVNKGTILGLLANAVCICAMMWSSKSSFQIDDVFNSITTQVNNIINKYNAVVKLSRYNWITRYNNKQISMEELIRIIPFDSTPDENSAQIINIDEKWTLVQGMMQTSNKPNIIPVVPEDTANFTSTVYVCPTCGKFITKVLLQETYINVEGDKKEIDKTFSCKYCVSFYAPVIGHNLNEGSYYYLKVCSSRYKELVKEMDRNSRKRLR